MSSGNVKTGVLINKNQGKFVDVHLREGDGSPIKVQLPVGTQVQILNAASVDANRHRWYHVQYQDAKHGQSDGYVRDDFIQENSNSQNPGQSGSIKKLKIIYGTGTWFKARPEDASQLGDDLKVFISNNTVYNILSQYTEENSHYRFVLADGQLIKGKNTWYAFKGHVQIS